MDRLKLKHITLKGFKSFSYKEGVNLGIGSINVLLGANGAGKSNLISFFKMLTIIAEGKFQKYVAVSGTADIFLHYGAAHTKEIEFSLEFDDSKSEYKYDTNISFSYPDRLIIGNETFKDNTETINFPNRNDESSLISNRNSRPGIACLHQFITTSKVFQFHDTSADSPLRLPSHIDAADYLQSNGANLAAYLYQMKNKEVNCYHRIIRYISGVMPQFGDFYLTPNPAGYVMLKWQDNMINDYIQIPQQISDGSLRFMAMAALLLQPADKLPPLIILDEPELGLHPYAIDQLAEMIKEAAIHTQVIIATQSPGLVDEFSADQVIVIERDEEKECSIAGRLNEKELSEWLEHYSLSELWDKNVIGGRP